MGNLWLKIKVWTKVVLFSALAFYALLFIYNNDDNQVELWIWFRTKPRRSVLLYMLFAFLIGVVGTILVRTTVRTIAQIRELRARSAAEKAGRRMAQMESKAGKLQTRTDVRAEARPSTNGPARSEPHAESLPILRAESRTEPPLHPLPDPPPEQVEDGAEA